MEGVSDTEVAFGVYKLVLAFIRGATEGHKKRAAIEKWREIYEIVKEKMQLEIVIFWQVLTLGMLIDLADWIADFLIIQKHQQGRQLDAIFIIYLAK